MNKLKDNDICMKKLLFPMLRTVPMNSEQGFEKRQQCTQQAVLPS